MRRLTALQSPVFLANSRLGLLRCGCPRPRGERASTLSGTLLPRLRGDFAEFLNHGSPIALGMLYPPTCVGLRYGHLAAPRGFSRSVASPASPRGFAAHLAPRANFAAPGYVRSRGRPEPRRATLLRHPVGDVARRWCRNVDLLCVGWAPSGLALAPGITDPWRISRPGTSVYLRRRFPRLSRYHASILALAGPPRVPRLPRTGGSLPPGPWPPPLRCRA